MRAPRLVALLLAALPAAPARPQEARVAEAVRRVDAVVAGGPFAAQWTSLEKFQVPRWYLDGKFGIFIHWGVYSVPASLQRHQA
jgi:alpha-L-fucosidase